MSVTASAARWHRILALAAALHAALLLVTMSAAHEKAAQQRLWVGAATLWLFWPMILALHTGASARRVYLSVSLSALLLFLPMQTYFSWSARTVLGGEFGPSSFGPYDVGMYLAGYVSGWVDSRRHKGGDTIAVEGFGMGGNITPGVPPLSYEAQRRYNVRLNSIALCMVDSYILGRASGYNAVSAAVLKQRYGADIMNVLEREWTLEQERVEAAGPAGRADAERDIREGHLALAVLNEHFPAKSSEFDRTPLVQHGVALRPVVSGDDPVTGEVLRHSSAYNYVAEAEIRRRFGVEAAEIIVDAAKQRYLYPAASE